MKNLLSRLDTLVFNIILFGNDCILNKPVKEWPLCDVFLAFYSDGFPLNKALEYSILRQPLLINDIQSQFISFFN